jgi:hypothetical protein
MSDKTTSGLLLLLPADRDVINEARYRSDPQLRYLFRLVPSYAG